MNRVIEMQAKDISREILFLPLPFSISFKPKGWLVEHSWNVIRTNGRDEIAWKGSEVGEINGTCSGGDLREKYIRITRVCVATVDEDGIYGMPLFFLSFLRSLHRFNLRIFVIYWVFGRIKLNYRALLFRKFYFFRSSDSREFDCFIDR